MSKTEINKRAHQWIEGNLNALSGLTRDEINEVMAEVARIQNGEDDENNDEYEPTPVPGL